MGASVVRRFASVSRQRTRVSWYLASKTFDKNDEQGNTTAEQWQFLTTDQALEDVVYFADRFTLPSVHFDSTNASSVPDMISRNPLHPSNTPWVWLGGSYPGVRGALLRVRNPETIFAVWASSAPVHAQVDMAAYYKAAERSLTRNCSADWVAVTRFVDDTLANGTAAEAADLKFKLLSARDGSITKEQAANASNVNAAGVLMDPLNFYQVCVSGYRRSRRHSLIRWHTCSTMDSKLPSFHSAMSWRLKTRRRHHSRLGCPPRWGSISPSTRS